MIGRARSVPLHQATGWKEAFEQGDCILIARGKDFEEVIFLPARLKLPGMDAAFGSFLMFEQVESTMTQDREIFRGMVFADLMPILVQSDIQHPVELIFNRPVLAHNF